MCREDIIPLGWGEEFDKEDRIVTTTHPQGPQVIRVNIWYDSNKEAKK